MHPTRREMLRLGLGSSALLACGPTVPLFLARSASALADDRPAVAEGPHPGRRPARRRQRRPEHRGAVSRRRVPQAPAEAGDRGRRGEEDRRPHRAAPVARARSRSCWSKQRLAIVQSVGYPNPNRSHFDSMAIWQTARTTADKAAPGWLARAIDRRPRPGRRRAGRCTSTSRSRCRGRWPGGRQVVPSLARLEQFRRRLGMPEGADAAAQIEALDRLARQDRGEPGSLLQFVERCCRDHVCQQRAARAGAAGQASARRSTYPEFYGLARRLRLIAQLSRPGCRRRSTTRTSTASTRTAASSSGTRTCCASWARRSRRSSTTWRNRASRTGCWSWSSPSSAGGWARTAAAGPTTAPRPPSSCWASRSSPACTAPTPT